MSELPADTSYLECNLPEFLNESIEQMVAAWNKLDRAIPYLSWDLDYGELQSNINVAEVEEMITHEQANYLRVKYLRMSKEDLS